MSNDDAYANAAHIPGADAYPARWSAAAAAFRAALGARAETGLAYGPGARQRMDVFRPEGTAEGTVVFVHGGYWRRFGREDWSHLAAGALARGWAVAMPGYTLAPEAAIADITGEIARAVDAVARSVEGPLRVTGHSAGGHLVARMLCADVDVGAAEGRIAACVPISPVADLRPLIETEMNADFRLDDAAAAAESPALMEPAREARVHVWVGADERPAFLDQARALATAWDTDLTVEPGRHHFDVIDSLAEPHSPLMRAVMG
ncbi:alpha/beta hydrolase [Rhodobacteraceae bacterium CCMM004]|nr:alpha/beta hydrolase [Rhodobacteraceae bacterium CCMM004]